VIFIKFDLGEGIPGSHLHTKFQCSGLKSVSLQPSKSRKIAIFCKTLPMWENFWDSQKTFSIVAQLHTFLYAITPIKKLKITPLHSELDSNMHHLPKAVQYWQAPSAIFLAKLGMGRVSQVRSRKFRGCGFTKCGPTGDKIAKIGIFLV